MKLKRPLPPNRNYDQVKNHYLVEKAIAEKLKRANRQERKYIYATMYDDLFSKVPDHPRLTRRESDQLTLNANRSKFSIVQSFLNKSATFVEFAPGDCRFSIEVAKHVKFVYGVDISDQHRTNDNFPENFKLLIYDGYNLKGIDDNSVDIVFSDQLIEHFHPEDTVFHFDLVYRILKKDGKYVFRTPHAFNGPSDVSQFFSDISEGFHLKEWTYCELKHMLADFEFMRIHSYWHVNNFKIKVPLFYFELFENILTRFPKKYLRVLAKYFLRSIFCVVIK